MVDKKEAAGCGEFEKLIDDNKVKIKQMQTGSGGKPVVFFVEILSTLGKNPCHYLKLKHPNEDKCVLIQKNVREDDGQVWDWYALHCPYGPPCDFMESL